MTGGLEGCPHGKALSREFRDDVVRVARNRDDGVTIEQIATDFGVHPMTLWRVPVSESTRFLSRVGVIQIQLMLQATGVWVHLQTAAYSAGVR